ncbi:MAG: hypothetical protein IKA07_03870 [Alistipes sp.]|nr:hypothetical protein [Alistipes sp.]
MKRIAIIFTMIVSLVAVSCVTDTTQEIDRTIGGANQTYISLSLEHSRTQLGEKVGDLYPLYWSEGDQISINGVASNTLTAEQSGSSKATFVVSGTLQTPYCIAYPAAAEGKIRFAEKQSHAGNTTFGSGVSTMYGYSNDGIGAQLTHLTGVLKLGIVGSDKLVMAQISTIDRAPIAGEFDLDFESGEVTATDASKDVIEYSFGEGVQLSAEPTYIHVAVPAGVYEELYITLYDINGGVMYARVKADDTKPLTAGNVRTFSNTINYASIAQSLFVVSNAATLKSFAEQAATLTKDVLFVADVDMSAEEWTPIEGYANTINGNGYAIKGLKAPLFGTTSAKIKGLHLTELDAEWTTYAKAGAFAVHLAEGGVLSHCSTDGKIHINNTTYAEAVVRQQYDFIYGGLVGLTTGATIEHCENNADITITSVCSQSVAGTNFYGFSFGGVVGAADLIEGGSPTSITHAVNRGEILINNSSPLSRGYYWMGGVFGQTIANNSLSAFSHCYNYGSLSTKKDCSLPALRLGGVFGDLATNEISTCDFIENHGDIFVHGEVASNVIQVYGIGYTAYVIDGVNDCLNTGDINVQSNALGNMYICGGILGITASSETKGVCHRMKNEGNITFAPHNASSKMTGTLTVAGLTNNLNCGIEGTADNPSGNSGAIRVTSVTQNITYIAGVANTLGEGFTLKNVENSGSITVDGEVTGTEGDLYACGIGTTLKANSILNNVKNSGAIDVSGSADRYVITVGIANEVRCTMTDVSNSADINVSATSGSNAFAVGIGRLVYLKATNVYNTGDITYSGTATAGTIRVAGLYATLGNNSLSTDAANPSSNSGTVTFNGKALDKTKDIKVAGFAAVLNYSKGVSKLLNKGNVVCVGVAENVAPIHLGGLACDINHPASNCENRGTVSFSGVATGTMYASGIGVTMGATGTLTNVTNNGKITSTGTHNAQVRLSGIIGYEYAGGTLTGARNNGDIEMNGEVKASIGIAGIWPVNQKADATFTDCHNSGVISVISTAENVSSNNIAGLVGYTAKNMTFDGCSNSGKVVDGVNKGIYVDQPVKHGYFDIGGCVGYVYKSKITFLNGFTNSADIYVKATNSYAGTYPVGGVLAVYNTANASYEGWTGTIKNTGKITFDGDASASKTLAVGGIIGISGAASEATLVNTGDIAITDTAKIPATNGFGGIIGVTTGTIKGAQAHFTLEKSKDVVANVGFITGSARSATVTASECGIGGRILTGWDDSDAEPEPIYTKLNSGNYYNYIYGSGNATDWTGTDNYDGCTYISSAPTL